MTAHPKDQLAYELTRLVQLSIVDDWRGVLYYLDRARPLVEEHAEQQPRLVVPT